ncbi:MAG: phosphate ABC transporter permease subunit PstC [Acidobacteriota bacterium]|nr:phosphate ABC transporter permease subunit PstC [Acidobacteriota bacterium]
MASIDTTSESARRPFEGRRVHLGDVVLQGVAGAAAAGATALVLLIAWKVVDGARPSISKFGISFVWHDVWNPVVGREAYGAASFLFGTAITSFVALLLAAPLAIGIALFLTELAPRVLRGPVTSLVETLAAIPSVVVGLWGILVLGPALRSHVEPWLHSALGWIPLFGPPSSAGASIFTAIVVLTIMILPIVSSISRELFLGVPAELKEGALALGTTRWEMVRGVVFPYARGGIAAALILGLGRAMGEAIAVTQVIGGGTTISWNLFNQGDTLASKIAAEYQGATSNLDVASLIYLGLILLVLSLGANIAAQWIVRGVARRHGVTRGGRA